MRSASPNSSTTANRSAAHTALVNDIIKALGRDPDVFIAPRHVGTFRHLYSEAKIKTGVPGEPDIQGFVTDPSGGWARWFGLEVKTGTAVPTDQQRRFHRMAAGIGGFVAVVHSVDEARDALERVRAAR